jgi:hypothetical protein
MDQQIVGGISSPESDKVLLGERIIIINVMLDFINAG